MGSDGNLFCAILELPGNRDGFRFGGILGHGFCRMKKHCGEPEDAGQTPQETSIFKVKHIK
jgi:hypothetical protein